MFNANFKESLIKRLGLEKDMWYEHSRIKGPDGMHIFKKYSKEFEKPNGPERIVVYASIDDTIFVNSQFKKQISQTEGIIFLHNFQSYLGKQSHGKYTACTLSALNNVDVEKKVVLDLGCGDGVLSLVSYNQGASIIGVDKYRSALDDFEKHIDENGYDKGRFLLLRKSINSRGLVKILPEVDIVIANLGAHYGSADISAIKLASKLGAKTFVGGGYVKPTHGREELGYEEAFKKLGSLGYAINAVYKEDDLINPRMSFIAQRL